MKLNFFYLAKGENIIPLKLNYNTSKEADLFENKIKSMLSKTGVKNTKVY